MKFIYYSIIGFLAFCFLMAIVEEICNARRKRNAKRFPYLMVFAFFLAGLSASAQTTNAIPSIGDTISTIGGWLGNINTNYHYANVIAWDGPVYESGVNVANELGASYDIWRSVTNANTSQSLLFGAIETRDRQTGIIGAWQSEAFGGEFGWQRCDFRAGLFVDGVYLNQPLSTHSRSHFAGEAGLFADKMLSSATAIGVFASGQTEQRSPLVGANLKLTFGNGTGFLGLFKH